MPRHAASHLKVLLEEARRLHVDSHRGEDDGEGLLRVVTGRALDVLLDQAGLPADLRGDLVVRQARGREEGDLLAACDLG